MYEEKIFSSVKREGGENLTPVFVAALQAVRGSKARAKWDPSPISYTAGKSAGSIR